MNNIIGKYNGIKVYKVTLPEYVNSRLYKDEENMYLIDGDIIYKNEIFAKFDGRYVDEWPVHQRAIFYKIPEVKIKDRGVEWTVGTLEADVAKTAEVETKNSLPVGPTPNFEFKTVDEILAGSTGMTDVDAFLKNVLES